MGFFVCPQLVPASGSGARTDGFRPLLRPPKPGLLPFCFSLVVFLFVFLGPARPRVPTAAAQLLINEFYYDHPGSDDGYEYVEIFSTAPGTVVLDGVALEFHNGAAEGWTTLWVGGTADTVAPGGLFVLGGADVSPPPQALVTLRLQNGPDAIRLTVDGIPCDLAGYGGLDQEFYVETESAPGVPAGFALGRLPDGVDTDNNALDFYQVIPSPGLFNVPRHDLAVSAGPGTQIGDVAGEEGLVEIELVLTNNGQAGVPAGALAVEVWDSTLASTELLQKSTNAVPIAPKNAAAVPVDVFLRTGYHWIVARVFYQPDERIHNNTLVLLRRIGGPRLLVSEVLSYPFDGCPQFVELFNAGGGEALIRGFKLRDKSCSPSVVTDDSVVVRPLGFLVLTPDEESLRRFFPGLPPQLAVEQAGAWPAFNRSGSGTVSDSVVFLDAYSLPVDAVAYPPVGSDHRGRSLERVDLYLGPASPTWVLSNDPRGASPGQCNARSLFERPPAGSVAVAPNPFSPYDGAVMTISVNPPSTGVRAVVCVYALNGRKLKDLGSSTAFPAVFVWEGTDGDGRVLIPGLYMVTCEMFTLAGDRIVTEKVVVGCGRTGG